MSEINKSHPLYGLFGGLVHSALGQNAVMYEINGLQDYVTRLLIQFSKTEEIFRIKNRSGATVTSVYEMLAEADVRINADSFERERQVHKHIGDYILFWSGVNPNYLNRIKLSDGRDLVCDYAQQAKSSYYVVSTFDYSPFESEAPLYRLLSDGFDDLSLALRKMSHQLPFHQAS